MSARSKVAQLPHKVRTRVEHQIIDRAFSGYRQLAEQLRAKGYELSEDGLQRHGARLRRELETVQLGHHHARMLGEAAPQPMQMLEAMLRMVHVRLLAALMGEAELEQRDFALMRAVSEFGRSLWTQQRMAHLATAARPPAMAAEPGARPPDGPCGISNEAAKAMRHMLLGEYIDRRAPDSRLTEEEHRKLRDSMIQTGAVVLNDPLGRFRRPQPPAGAAEGDASAASAASEAAVAAEPPAPPQQSSTAPAPSQPPPAAPVPAAGQPSPQIAADSRASAAAAPQPATYKVIDSRASAGATDPPRPKPLTEYPYRYQELPPNDDVRTIRRRLNKWDLMWY